jgi:4'-phosphopantetheinyl transferase, N-terminal
MFERRPDRQVHVWRVSIDVEPGRLRALRSVLSTDEHERAERLRFPRDRQRFVARRGLLRTILGKYVGANPRELRFSYGRFGKPAVASGKEPSALEFSLSHSAGLVLLAVTKREGIGIISSGSMRTSTTAKWPRHSWQHGKARRSSGCHRLEPGKSSSACGA